LRGCPKISFEILKHEEATVLIMPNNFSPRELLTKRLLMVITVKFMNRHLAQQVIEINISKFSIGHHE